MKHMLRYAGVMYLDDSTGAIFGFRSDKLRAALGFAVWCVDFALFFTPSLVSHPHHRQGRRQILLPTSPILRDRQAIFEPGGLL